MARKKNTEGGKYTVFAFFFFFLTQVDNEAFWITELVLFVQLLVGLSSAEVAVPGFDSSPYLKWLLAVHYTSSLAPAQHLGLAGSILVWRRQGHRRWH